MAYGLDSTKSGERPSHEAIENSRNEVPGVAETPEERVDDLAMDMAKRAQNRIKANEGVNPGTQIFTK